MSQAVLLDAGPLGLVTNPRRSLQSAACAAWLQSLVTAGVRVVIPEIADYEVRRELLRARKTAGVERLDALAGLLEYLRSRRLRCDRLQLSGRQPASKASLRPVTEQSTET